MQKTKTPNKGKTTVFKSGFQNGYKSINKRSWIKFSTSFMQQFIGKTGKIISMIAFM